MLFLELRAHLWPAYSAGFQEQLQLKKETERDRQTEKGGTMFNGRFHFQTRWGNFYILIQTVFKFTFHSYGSTHDSTQEISLYKLHSK